MSPLSPNDNIDAETVEKNLAVLRKRISAAEQRYGRRPGSVTLVAVSKSQPAAAILAAYRAGQRDFGESYLQEALAKQSALTGYDITWHFIGALQANKTCQASRHFTWIHSVDRLKIAERLNQQCPSECAPLNVCLQVNLGEEQQKAGVAMTQLSILAEQLNIFPKLRLRGLMALPPHSADFEEQRRHFRHLRLAYEQLLNQAYPLDTLSMGMSTDLEAAIAEGATIIRIGTALFGERLRKP